MRQIIRAERLFDGTGSAPAPAEIVIDGDRITEVHRGGGTVAREGDQVLDLREGTLLPGLIDSHLHAVFGGISLLSADAKNDIADIAALEAFVAEAKRSGRPVGRSFSVSSSSRPSEKISSA